MKYKFMTEEHVKKLETLDESYGDALVAFGRECIHKYRVNYRKGFIKGAVGALAVIGIYEGTGAVLRKIFDKIEEAESVEETIDG